MGSTLLLWAFGGLLAVVTFLAWLQLVRFALTGRWPAIGGADALSDAEPQAERADR